MINKKKHYLALDAARGVAAVMVLLYHLRIFLYSSMFGEMDSQFTKSYLAVDLFFLMSGVVIARSYSAKLLSGQMTVKNFVIIRLIRLYPMYAVGMLMGAVYIIMRSIVKDDDPISVSQLLMSGILNGFLLPDFFNKDGLFVFDSAAWSLSMEWIINLIYAVFAVRFSMRTLIGVTIGAAVGVVISATDVGNMDMGWSVSNFHGGLCRILFSFTLGLVFYRMMENKCFSPIVSAVPLLLVLAVILWNPFGIHSVVYDIFCVLVAFPVFVFIACFSSVPAYLEKTCSWLGDISYPLYIMHIPMLFLMAVFWKLFINHNLYDVPLLSAAFIFTIILLASHLAVMFFDEPVRKMMRAYFLENKGAAV